MSDESNKALHQMCKYLCEGLPHIDDFDVLAKKLTSDDESIYGVILRRHEQYFGAGLGMLDYAQDIRRIRRLREMTAERGAK